MCDTITGYVNAGIIPSGWHLAYGSLNSYTSDRLTKDLHSKKRVGNTEAKVTFERLQEQIDKGYTKLGEFIIGDE